MKHGVLDAWTWVALGDRERRQGLGPYGRPKAAVLHINSSL
ncbi:hypothetical protein L843_2733 [Mycobacterium intracellulare MIN_061107_1834]|nr:hypothetical protein L843_2733 [Mycobacterium intracellulare MIN_061107_1834]